MPERRDNGVVVVKIRVTNKEAGVAWAWSSLDAGAGLRNAFAFVPRHGVRAITND